MSEGDRMGNIARWELSDCPDCGCLTGATADQIAWCDEHCASDKTLVEVVRADAYRGAVERLDAITVYVDRCLDSGRHAALEYIKALADGSLDLSPPRGQ